LQELKQHIWFERDSCPRKIFLLISNL
jgi:hypothetical protein